MKKTILTRKDILHLAQLAKLNLSDKEIEKYQRQLEETVEYVKNLNELDTTDVSPTFQTTNLFNVGFDDGEKNSRLLSHQEAIKNAKDKKNGNFIVKRIM